MSYDGSKAVEEALKSVLPASALDIRIGGEQLSLKQCWLYFREYAGVHPTNSLDKPIVGGPDRPFAELQAVTRLERQGWTAAWLHGPQEFVSSWEPREDAQPPQAARSLLARVDSRAGENASRWDVMAWKPELRFIHMVRAGSSEMPSPSRLLWLQAALAEGVPLSTFEVWQWFGGALDGRVLRLTDYTLDRLDGWVEWRNGRLTYSEGRQRDGMVEHYRDWGAQTEADLLWLVFVRNRQGVTWCGIEEHAAQKDAAVSRAEFHSRKVT